MAVDLTNRQKEYLEFLQEYIWRNESAPRLEEIADYFGVKTPTAHKALVSLREKGLLYFGRDQVTGFFIRIPERIGTSEPVFDINIVGKPNRYGEIHEFPIKAGHFPIVLSVSNPESVFAVELSQHISGAGMRAGDLLIFDQERKSSPGDIGIMRFGNSWLLVRMFQITQDPAMPFHELVNEISPDDLQKIEREGGLFWWPLAINKDTEAYFTKAAIQYQQPWRRLLPEQIVATAIWLERRLTI